MADKKSASAEKDQVVREADKLEAVRDVKTPSLDKEKRREPSGGSFKSPARGISLTSAIHLTQKVQ